MSVEPVQIPITEKVDDLSKIDSQVAALYRRAAGTDAGGPTPTVRTVLFNLVAYACSEEDAEAAARSVGEVVGSHPCRAIVVDAMPPQPQEPNAYVSVICGITERGDRRLCGEVIRLHIHEDESAVIGSVMPLLVPDVPVVLWAPGRIPVGDAEFDELVGVSDSIIVDSRRFGDLGAGLDFVMRVASACTANRVVQDLAWISLLPWRELTAEHFDPPVLRHYLAEMLDVDISFGAVGDGLPPIGPLLFESWLMERAGVDVRLLRRAGSSEFDIDGGLGDRTVAVHLIGDGAGFAPGQMASVTIRCGDPDNPATFTTQGVSPTELVLTEECHGICFPPKTLELPPRREVALTEQALDPYRRDRIYEAALRIAARLLEQSHE